MVPQAPQVRRRERLLSRPCIDCGADIPRPPNVQKFLTRRCASCRKAREKRQALAAAARYRARNRARGDCPKCGRTPPAGQSYCERCLRNGSETRKRERERKKAQGQCVRCQSPALPGIFVCRRHQLKQAIADALKHERRRERLWTVPRHELDRWFHEDVWDGEVPYLVSLFQYPHAG